MLKSIALALLALIGAVLVYAATRPDSFRVERSTTIHASPDKVYALIQDFKQWEAWSPWETIDPQIKRTYSGAPSGVGAVYAWQGNKDVGQGRMEIVEAAAPTRLVLKLHFITPFEARNTVEFVLQAQGDNTRVSQAMSGSSPFVAKLLGLFFSMDKMVGGKYEEGLAKLKSLAEK
jgi:uncharacterized protein YndB with AHSA1/START domain